MNWILVAVIAGGLLGLPYPFITSPPVAVGLYLPDALVDRPEPVAAA